MVTKYPAAIDTVFSLTPILDGRPVSGGSVEQLRLAIIAIEEELGVKPSGVYATVRARLDSIENIVGNLRIIELDQDLGGTLEDPHVIGIHGRPISTVPPQPGEAYVWDGIAWTPGSLAANVHFGGDLRGNPVTQQTVGINTIPVRHGSFGFDQGYLKAQYMLNFSSCTVFDGTDLWVLSYNDDLVRINPAVPEILTYLPLPHTYAGSDHQAGLAFDSTHIYAGTFGSKQTGFTTISLGRVYIIRKSDMVIEGIIESQVSTGKVFGIAVDGDNIYVASGNQSLTISSGTDNNSQVDKYSKTAVLAAYPAPGTPIATLPPSVSNAYHGGFLFHDGFLFVTSFSVNGKIYKIQPSDMTVVDSFELGPNTNMNNLVFANGGLWTAFYDGESQHAAKFNPDDLASGAVPTAIEGAAGYGQYLSVHDGRWLTITHGTSSFIETVDTTPGTEAAYDIDLEDGGLYGVSYSDGTYVWTCNSSSGPLGAGIYAMHGDNFPNINIDHFFGGGLEIVYSTVNAGSDITFYNGGTTVGTFTGINALGAASFSPGSFGVDLIVNGVPPPGNAYDYLRLIPEPIFDQPQGLYFDENTSELWVANAGSNKIVRLNTQTFGGAPAIVNIITLPSVNKGWKIAGNDTHVVITTGSDGYVFVIDKNTNEVVGKAHPNGNVTSVVFSTDDTNIFWVVINFFGFSFKLYQYNLVDLLTAWPNGASQVLDADIPNGLIDFDDMTYIGGEGGYIVTGSAGYIMQFCSSNDGFTTLFENYGNPGFTDGIQIGGITKVFNFNNNQWELWTTSLGSQIIRAFNYQNLNGGPIPEFGIGTGLFTADIVATNQSGSDIWARGQNGNIVRVDTLSRAISTEFTIPATDTYGNPFTGMAHDPTNLYVWTADPLNNAIVAFSTQFNGFVLSFSGPISTQWAVGDVRFDSAASKSNLISSKNSSGSDSQGLVNTGKKGQINFSTTDDAGFYTCDGNYSVILAGHNNKIEGDYNTILNGFNNRIGIDSYGIPTASVISGGTDNVILDSGQWNTIAGGEGHFMIGATAGTIGGGQSNYVYSNYGTVAGGSSCGVQAPYGFVGGGQTVRALGSYSVAVGGFLNHTFSDSSFIGGGGQNNTGAYAAVVSGGQNNRAGGVVTFEDAPYSYIGGGKDANTSRFGQMAHAGGAFNFNFGGDAQFSRYLVRGEGIGSYNLTDEGGASFVLDVDKTYAIRATIIINNTIGNSGRAMYIYNMMGFCIGPNGPNATVVDIAQLYMSNYSGAPETVSFAAVDNTIVVTIDNAPNGSRAVCTYEWTEIGGSSDNNG